jgi:hypothetical protein
MPENSSELTDAFEKVASIALRVKAERDGLVEVCDAAYHALRSHQHGNASPDLAEEVAERIKLVLKIVRRGGE